MGATRRRECYNKINQSQTHPEDEPLAFDIEAIRTATNNFSDENKLGQGGFGPVYKGLLPNGQLVAVKRLASCSGQGESEFTNEIALMANLQHPNLVKLLGYCLDLEGNERILVYEFVTNKSLDRFIFDPIKRAEMDWATRYKIIEGLAQGLLYLHEKSRLKVIHRDVKASNILLDKDMNPKIADFGLARLFSDDQTHVTMSKVPGTYGYMAPEYLYHRRCSVKSDIFSFGVLILEIMSGQRNTMFDGQHEVDIRSVVWRNWRDRTPLNIVDPNLMREGSSNQMMRCIHIGLLCVQKIAQQRPETGRIVKMLKSHETLQIPSQPSIFHTDNATESEIELS
ncbi:hypothetical protein SLEP1_g41759 [Rubroshorea leprosula]|uniref:Protein kinase domain-containing protein n=1 Tax=Rubroshorea leprosula TaxID=152421 RepID=A0AAV5L7Q7_9ROSI|nr:hypothetical protein SLEP1_g41759 [Rubroshorea leprosula]